MAKLKQLSKNLQEAWDIWDSLLKLRVMARNGNLSEFGPKTDGNGWQLT
jgi:hypothetical protein